MKDYKRIASKVMRLGQFSDVHQCGTPSEYHPVDLHFTMNASCTIGREFYVSHSFGRWRIDYSEKPVKTRVEMRNISGIKTEREMLENVERILAQIRTQKS